MRAHEAARRGAILGAAAVALLCLLAAGATAAAQGQPAETLTYYRNGTFETQSLSTLKAVEQEVEQGGHMPWRRDPASVAAAMTRNLLPSTAPGEQARSEALQIDGHRAEAVVTPSWRAEYVVAEETANRALVDLRVNGEAAYRLTLVRPFESWWYLTEVEPTATAARPAPPAAEEGWVEVRAALERRGFTVTWHPRDRTVSVTGRRIRATLRAGSDRATVDGRVIALEAPATIVDGRTYAPRSLISEIVAADEAGPAPAS